MVNILNLSKVLSKVLANSPPGVRKNIPAGTAPSPTSYVSPEKMLYPTKQVADNLPPPKKLQGTGPRGGNTPNDKLIDRKIKKDKTVKNKIVKTDKKNILHGRLPPPKKNWRRQSENTLLTPPGSGVDLKKLPRQSSGSKHFQYFWKTMKPVTKFNQNIKKRVLAGTMTEKQAILTIKKKDRLIKSKKPGDLTDEERKIQNEWNEHEIDEMMGKDGKTLEEDHYQWENFDAFGNIIPPKLKSFKDLEKITLQKIKQDKIDKVNRIDKKHSNLSNFGDFQKGISESRVSDKKTKQGNFHIGYSDFEIKQAAIERIEDNIYGVNPGPRGASKDTGIFIFPERVTGKSPNVPDNKNTHIHTEGRDVMPFGSRIFPGERKEVIQWHNRAQDPLAKEFLADDVGPGAVKSPESWNIGINPWEQNKQGGDFYTAGQQSYSRDNAKLWRGIGLGLGGAGAMGLVGGQSAHASHYYDNEPPGSMFSRITPDNMKTMKQQITRRHHTNKNMFGNQQTGKYHDPTGFLSIHDQDLKHKGLPGKKAYSIHRKLFENRDGTWAFTKNV